MAGTTKRGRGRPKKTAAESATKRLGLSLTPRQSRALDAAAGDFKAAAWAKAALLRELRRVGTLDDGVGEGA